MTEPFYVAGTGQFGTDAMSLLGGAALVKSGAEGVFCAAVPEQGIAIALKCDDGASRAAESMVAATLARFFRQDAAVHEALMGMADHALRTGRAERRAAAAALDVDVEHLGLALRAVHAAAFRSQPGTRSRQYSYISAMRRKLASGGKMYVPRARYSFTMSFCVVPVSSFSSTPRSRARPT